MMPELPSLNVSSEISINDQVNVWLIANSELDQEAMSSLLNGIDAFVYAGAKGGYPASVTQTGNSNLILTAPLARHPNGAHFILEMHEISRNSFQLLRHMLSKPELPGYVLEQIQIRDSSGKRGEDFPEIDESTEVELYPPLASNIGFAIEYDEDDFSKSRRVEVEFSAAIGVSEIASLKSYSQAWDSLLEAGAFALPYGLPDIVESVMGQVTQFDTHSAEIEVPVYNASEEGWNILLNILNTFSKCEHSIVRVLVE